MSADSLVFWIFAIAWIVVIGLILFIPLPLAVREARRIVKRILALIDDSPLPLQIAKAEADALRMERALERIPSLQGRAVAAIAVIRTTPIVPPAVVEVAARVSNEIRAFVRAAR